MKVVAFNGSARKMSNTAIMLNRAMAELEQEGFETELVSLAGSNIKGCSACYRCMKNMAWLLKRVASVG